MFRHSKVAQKKLNGKSGKERLHFTKKILGILLSILRSRKTIFPIKKTRQNSDGQFVFDQDSNYPLMSLGFSDA